MTKPLISNNQQGAKKNNEQDNCDLGLIRGVAVGNRSNRSRITGNIGYMASLHNRQDAAKRWQRRSYLHARQTGIPVLAVAGRVESRDTINKLNMTDALAVTPTGVKPEIYMQQAIAYDFIRRAVKKVV